MGQRFKVLNKLDIVPMIGYTVYRLKAGTQTRREKMLILSQDTIKTPILKLESTAYLDDIETEIHAEIEIETENDYSFNTVTFKSMRDYRHHISELIPALSYAIIQENERK